MGKREDCEQNYVNHLLASMGFIFPRNEEELDSFDALYLDNSYELKDFRLNPDKLIADIECVKIVPSQKLTHQSNSKTYFKRADKPKDV